MASDKAQASGNVVRAALGKIRPYLLQRFRRESRGGIQPRILAVVAGNDRQMDTALAGQGRQLIDAVTPVILTAEQPDQHETRLCDYLVEIEIDGKRVLQRREIGEPEARQRAVPASQAAASTARSVSVKDKATISAGV